MSDLHIKLSKEEEHRLDELVGYCRTTRSKLIRILIDLSYSAAHMQVYGGKPKTIYQKFMIQYITAIFDELYPTTEELK